MIDEAAITNAVGAFDFDAWWDIACAGALHDPNLTKIEKKNSNGSITRGIQYKTIQYNTKSPFMSIGGIDSVTHDKNNKIKHIAYDESRDLGSGLIFSYVDMNPRRVWMISGRIVDFDTWIESVPSSPAYDKEKAYIIEGMFFNAGYQNDEDYDYYGVTKEQLVHAKLKYC